MIKSIKLTNFKNFREAELACGPLTLLIGANASGKSNVRDAFRFLHGIGRGYTLSEIISEKFGPGSELVWAGIRGGAQGIAYRQADTFALEVEAADVLDDDDTPCVYRIEVAPVHNGGRSRVVAESLYFGQAQVFATEPIANAPDTLGVRVLGKVVNDQPLLLTRQPALTQFVRPYFSTLTQELRDWQLLEKFEMIRLKFIELLGRMRFLEQDPKMMCQAASTNQEILGDRGEHLASVLQAICANPQRKAVLLSWIHSLTPMDIADLEFILYPDGNKVTFKLIEADGQLTSPDSASGGTLRFLAILAALFGPQTHHLFFFEELENGIHPTRQHLLLELLEKQARRNRTQVIATTHSPQLLRLVSPETLNYTSLIYRLENQPNGCIQRLQQLPEQALQVIHKNDLANLYESGWFEHIVSFLEAEKIV